MIQNKISVIIENGLHARPASLLVQLANGFESEISIKTDKKKLDAKSILSLMSAGIREKEEILIEVSGSDEEVAMNQIVNFFSTAK